VTAGANIRRREYREKDIDNGGGAL